jgi:ankyrin repeat protein
MFNSYGVMKENKAGTTMSYYTMLRIAADHLEYPDCDSALHQAARDGDLQSVRKLVERGDYINAKNSAEETPLDVAERKRRREVVSYLRDCGAKKGSDIP